MIPSKTAPGLRAPIVFSMAVEPTIEVLYFDGCPHHEPLLAQLRTLIAELQLDARIHRKRVDSVKAAKTQRFLGSPTVRINGHDVDPTAAQRTDYGLKCRLYTSDHGLRGAVPPQLIRTALNRTDS